MKHYKDGNDKVYAYEDDISKELLDAKILELGLIAITETEAKELTKVILSLEDTKINKKKELENSFNTNASLITTALPHEMASWDKQESQARAWNNDNTVVTPIIDELLVARNFDETKQDLVNKIIGNADAYEVVYGQLLGKYQNLLSQVDGATTIADVEAIIWVEDTPPTI